MYLKSIEVHGFKSFANKIVFDFHNGITGIVGPNGSGKSNVGDAVRWVLGEQSAKQLRGASMQDIIFAGTENRKPLSYAYVAITMDNSDHALPVEFEEVTVARRVYRSGESEYLLNGNPCRLKDVTELFYDTGIGKEGYSIIGQGQIERILNGKPEERRELFDEAAGIVKYKKRKATAQKKLENERENLVRVNDILSELERQVGPLEKQAEKARIYLKKKEELKTFDVNMFLLEMERIDKQLKEVQDNFQIADGQLKEKNETYTNIKSEYEKLERDVEAIEEKITSIRDTISNSSVTKGKLEGQINVLNEQIHTAKMTDEHMRKRLEAIESEKKERLSTKSGYEKEKADLDGQLTNISERKETAQNQYQEVQEKAAKLKEEIENGKNELIQLLNQKASIKARIQRNDTMVEQINIRRAQLNQRLLARKSEETDLESVLEEYQLKLDETNQEIAKLREKSAKMENERREWKQKSIETTKTLEESLAKYHKNQSRLESLKNIAERYDGYGNSIRKVMEQKAANKGLLGVVSDLIQVDKKYEIAIETALGGNIQNIVTEDEETAKKMISYLKANRFGRATFLPITSVDGRGNFKNHDALKEKGVIGLANTLVKTDAKYEGVIAYLLGRVVVTENIDHAIALARKNHYSLHIVTLEGEYLSPGGSMAGGAFKNSSNLLARKREVEELEKKVQDLDDAVKDSRKRLEEIKTAQALLADDMEENRKNLQELILAQNTAKMNVDRVVSKKNESETVYQGLQTEHKEMEGQLAEIEQEKAKIAKESEDALAREKEIGVQNETYQRKLEEQDTVIEKAGNELSRIQLEEANLRQKAEFVTLNIERIETELAKFDAECEQVQKEAEEAKEEVQKRNRLLRH